MIPRSCRLFGYFSMPSPSAKRAKPTTLIGAPALPSESFTACATLFGRVMNVGLVEQPHFFVEGLESRLDNLADHGLGFSLGAKFIRKHILLARHDARFETGRIDGERARGRDMHCDLAAELGKFVRLPLRLERDKHADLSDPSATEL